jgi:hypothetical protein
LTDAIAASKKQITYNLNHDGSVILRSLRGITGKELKRMSDDELKAIGLFKTLIGKDEKFFPTDETLALRYQEKSKPSASPDTSKGMNTQEAFLIAQQRGYSGNDKSFRDRFDKSGYGETFGLRRVPHKQGRENWLYFDTKTQS